MTRKKQSEIQKEFKLKKKLESCLELMKEGEDLGLVLMTMLAEYGSSREALIVETYAVAKLYGALKAIAEDKGFDAEGLFEELVPSFVEETKEELKN